MDTIHFRHIAVAVEEAVQQQGQAANVDPALVPSTAYCVLANITGDVQPILDDVKQGGQRFFHDMPMTLVNADMLTSSAHITVAVHQAMTRNARRLTRRAEADAKTMQTKTIHSEVLWNLCLSNNVAEAFRTFGLSPSTRTLLFIHMAAAPGHGGPNAQDVEDKIRRIVEGIGLVDEAGLSALNAWRTGTPQPVPKQDWDAIGKAYNVQLHAPGRDSRAEQASRQKDKVDSLVTSLVARKYVAA